MIEQQFCRPRGDFGFLYIANPGLKRWAIFRESSHLSRYSRAMTTSGVRRGQFGYRAIYLADCDQNNSGADQRCAEGQLEREFFPEQNGGGERDQNHAQSLKRIDEAEVVALE